MPGTHNRNDQPPANARRRRQEHAARARTLSDRKRLRRDRATANEEYIAHQRFVEATRAEQAAADAQPASAGGPYTVATTKTADGWAVLDVAGNTYRYRTSRTEARALRDELNGS